MWSQIQYSELTGSIGHFTLNSQLLLVNFYFIFSQFQINRARFSLVFPTYIQFCTQIVVIFLEPFQQPNFLADLEESAHILSSVLPTVFQVINNIPTSNIDKSFNLHQKSLNFRKISNDRATALLVYVVIEPTIYSSLRDYKNIKV